MGLSYDYPEKEKACASKPLKVKLDNRHVGEIRKVKDGYQYFPKDEKTGGEVFTSVPDVQNSLLSSQPSKADRKVDSTESDSDKDEIMEQAKKGLKKLTEDNKKLVASMERAETLLTATVDLLGLQIESKDVLNLLEQTVAYDGTDCDGHTHPSGQ